MELIAKLLSFTRTVKNGANVTDVKTDPGGGANITAEHFSSAGDDAFPLTSDYVKTSTASATGQESAVGYVDPLNTPKALEGEKRSYSRESSQGRVIAESWLKNDGTAVTNTYKVDGDDITLAATHEMKPDGTITHTVFDTDGTTAKVAHTMKADGSIKGDNGTGSYELQANGNFVVNTVIIDTSGNVTSPASIIAPSMVVDSKELKDHTHLAGTPPGDTGPNKA